MMFVGLVITLLVTRVLCQGPPPQPEPECYLMLGGAATVAPDDKSQSFWNMDETKIVSLDESTTMVTGEMVLHNAIKANYMLRIVVKKEKMGKTEIAFSYDMCDFCAELKNPDSQFKMEMDAMGFFAKECPIEPGKYGINNLSVNTNDLPINAPNEGIYKAELCVYETLDEDCKEVDLQGCVVLPFTIECS